MEESEWRKAFITINDEKLCSYAAFYFGGRCVESVFRICNQRELFFLGHEKRKFKAVKKTDNNKIPSKGKIPTRERLPFFCPLIHVGHYLDSLSLAIDEVGYQFTFLEIVESFVFSAAFLYLLYLWECYAGNHLVRATF
jgi:hypothetical protein